MSTEMIEFPVHDHTLRLRIQPGVFAPNLTTRLIAEHMHIPPGARVLDLGCGVGPLAILAAQRGAAEVVAVDVMPEACACARENARLNGVADKVDIRAGHLFEPVQGEQFDVIIDDVSGMAESVSRISPWYPETIPSGGPDGTGPTIAMLERVREFLREQGQLYFPVLSLANSHKILHTARERFNDQMESVTQKWIPFCEEFRARMADMEALRDEGLIDYISRRSRHLWRLEIFRVYA
jgi:release factor glutamine methyltransferase